MAGWRKKLKYPSESPWFPEYYIGLIVISNRHHKTCTIYCGLWWKRPSLPIFAIWVATYLHECESQSFYPLYYPGYYVHNSFARSMDKITFFPWQICSVIHLNWKRKEERERSYFLVNFPGESTLTLLVLIFPFDLQTPLNIRSWWTLVF